MEVKELMNILEEHADKEQAIKMSAYMKDQFEFLGIPKPKLKGLAKPFLDTTKKKPIDWNIVFELWENEYREAQYVALLYIELHKKQLQPTDLLQIKQLVITKSWWETVDQLDGYVGLILLQDESIKKTMIDWSTDDNMWLRRVAIDCQQKINEATDTDLLQTVILNNVASKEFFIQKSIGWSLREYGYTNPTWVKEFLNIHSSELASLSIKEASKKLN